MRRRFVDRVVVITGAGSGIGRATAVRFAAEGARVFALDVDVDGLAATAAVIASAEGLCSTQTCDVSVMAEVTRSIATAVRELGALHVLVNAAGIGAAARFEELTPGVWQRVLGVNLNGAFHTTQAALPELLRHGAGTIVNVASTAAMRGQAYCSHYAASKAALLNFTRSVALEFASRRLRANCVCPGPVRTPLIRNFIPRQDFEQQLINYYRPPVPGQSFAPEQAAEVIAFLASDAARTINGAALLADGGTLA